MPLQQNEAVQGAICLRPAPDVRWVAYDQGLVTFGDDGARLEVYNPTAALLWQRLSAGASREDLIAVLVRTFGVEAVRVAPDVDAILDRWRAGGLLAGSARADDPAAAIAGDELPAPAADHAPPWTIALGLMRITLLADAVTDAFLRSWLGHLETAEAGPSISIGVEPAEGGALRLVVGEREWFRTHRRLALTGGLYQAIIEAAYPDAAWLGWLHGGAVARDGGAVALTGPSGSGKSTLIAHLLTRGFRLLTDDLIALTAPDGSIVPWPAPLSLKPGAWTVLAAGSPALGKAPVATFRGRTERLYVPPPAAWCETPRPARAIVFPRYAAGAATTLTPLQPLTVLQRFVEDRCYLGYPLTLGRVRAFLDWLAQVPAYGLEYSDLDEAAACIEARVPQ